MFVNIFLEIVRLLQLTFLEIKVFSSGMLATLSLSPSLQTFFRYFYNTWAHLLQKLSF